MERLGTLPFVAQPGEAWVYGYNTDILGCIVEKASGCRSMRSFASTSPRRSGCATRIFFCRRTSARLASVYCQRRGRKIVRAPDGARGQGAYVDGPRRNSGRRGDALTARDYARFLEAMRRGGSIDGTRILSPLAVQLMSTNQVGTLHSTTGLGFGLGFETVDRFGANAMSEGRIGLGRRIRIGLSRRSRREAGDGADDPVDS